MILVSSLVRDEFGKIDELTLGTVDSLSDVDEICEGLESQISHSGIKGTNDFIRIEIWVQQLEDTVAQLYYFKEFNGESKCVQTSYDIKKYKRKEGQIIRFPIEKIKNKGI